MNPEEEILKNQISPNQIPLTTQNQSINPPVIVLNSGLPFNVENDLNLFAQVFVTKDIDYFRSVCCCEFLNKDYIVYGLLPDGDKKILFTSRKHFQCCRCCENCSISCCCGLCEYMCRNSIVFQMDYNRNGATFYTQGFNIQKGCYCCKCFLCRNCCCFTKLYLRENIVPDNPDPNVGEKKGKTIFKQCCCCCADAVVDYTNQLKIKGHSIRLTCCEMCLHSNCCFICCRCKDIEISIEDPNGKKTGKIIIPNGCCSDRLPDGSRWMFPHHYYEINFPAGITSAEKFQIIAEAIHLDLQLRIL